MEGKGSLETASTYLNNLLLARGLIQHGKNIEFSDPRMGEKGLDGTMIQIINLVHDLVLRRDDEQERRETLVGSIKSLKADATRQASAIERLEAKNTELRQNLGQAQLQAKSASSAAAAAELAAKSLRDELGKIKANVAHVRTSCANDIRKRDIQISKLKTYLTTAQRGSRAGAAGATVSIVPGSVSSGRGSTGTAHSSLTGVGGSVRSSVATASSPDYTVVHETADYMTNLSRSLSSENDRLISLVRHTLATLKDMLGLTDADESGAAGKGERADGSGLDNSSRTAPPQTPLPTSFESLENDMGRALNALGQLLTSPNFVSIDEVTVREEQLVRLRRSWDQMAQRWKEAMGLLDGWHTRMVSGGESIDIDELRRGLAEMTESRTSVEDEIGEQLSPLEESPKEVSLESAHESLSVNMGKKVAFSGSDRAGDITNRTDSESGASNALRLGDRRDAQTVRSSRARPQSCAFESQVDQAAGSRSRRPAAGPARPVRSQSGSPERRRYSQIRSSRFGAETATLTVEEKLQAVKEEAEEVVVVGDGMSSDRSAAPSPTKGGPVPRPGLGPRPSFGRFHVRTQSSAAAASSSPVERERPASVASAFLEPPSTGRNVRRTRSGTNMPAGPAGTPTRRRTMAPVRPPVRETGAGQGGGGGRGEEEDEFPSSLSSVNVPPAGEGRSRRRRKSTLSREELQTLLSGIK